MSISVLETNGNVYPGSKFLVGCRIHMHNIKLLILPTPCAFFGVRFLYSCRIDIVYKTVIFRESFQHRIFFHFDEDALSQPINDTLHNFNNVSGAIKAHYLLSILAHSSSCCILVLWWLHNAPLWITLPVAICDTRIAPGEAGSNHKPSKVWHETTHQFLNFNGCTVKVG